jgi:hypothetical protein
MSCRLVEGRWEVRWRDRAGRHRSRRFRRQESAEALDEAIHDLDVSERGGASIRKQSGGGVYPYETSAGIRWRYVARRSDGSLTSKRGFVSQSAAQDARRRLIEP